MEDRGFRSERSVCGHVELGLEDEEGEKELKEDEELKPWEQHSAVIPIPRYDYKAPSSLLERPHSGFLITCPFKREKSATKECIPILDEHMGFACTMDSENSERCSRNFVSKRRRSCLEDAEILDIVEKNKDSNLSENFCEVTKETSFLPVADENARSSKLSLVKLTRSGLLLFTMPNLNYHKVVDTLSSIFRSLDSGNLKPPIWCHRIFPIQEICCLTEKDLQAVVTNLVQQFFGSHQSKPERSIKLVTIEEASRRLR